MKFKPLTLTWCLVSILLSTFPLLAQEPEPAAEEAPKYAPGYTAKEDEAMLKAAGLPAGSEELLTWFNNKILTEEDQLEVKELIEELGHIRYRVREAASARLKKMGTSIEPFLEEAMEQRDSEVAHRAERALQTIQRQSTPTLFRAAIRLLAHRNPPGTMKALLQQLPLIRKSDEQGISTIHQAITSLALQSNGKPDPLLVEAIESDAPLVRAMSISSLTSVKALDLDAAKKALRDDSGIVRLWVAQSLIRREEKSAVPVLIQLIPELSSNQLWKVEGLLYQMAGEQAPNAPLEDDRNSRLQASRAWKAWWEKHGEKVDLAALNRQPPHLGLTLVCLRMNNGRGTVGEMDREGKFRWQITNLRYPMDAQILPNGNVLIAERSSSQVTERDRTGKIVWSHKVTSPYACYQMRNGRRMITSNVELQVLNRDKKVSVRYRSTRGTIYAARPNPRGGFVLLTSSRELVWVDSQGKFKRATRLVGSLSSYSTIKVLPNGHVLVPLYSNHKVVEVNHEGKILRTFTQLQYPISAQRLPNGRTLIGSYLRRKLVEVDPAGKVVKTTTMPGRVWYCHQR